MKLLVALVLLTTNVFIIQGAQPCEECQGIIKQIKEIVNNPSKLKMMQKSLTSLCRETNYAEECKAIASKLDVFAPQLLPYMQDDESVCRNFGMCSRTDMDGVRQLGLLLVKKFLNPVDGKADETCGECQKATHDLSKLVNNDAQKQTREFVSVNLCQNLGAYKKECEATLDTILPALFLEAQIMLNNNRQFCADINLCTKHEVNTGYQMTSNLMKDKITGVKRVRTLLKKLQALKTPQPSNLAMSCAECEVLVDVLIDALQTDKMINVTTGVLHGVLCYILPEEFGCGDFVDIYGTTVVYMTMQQLDAQSLCEAVQMCSGSSSGQMAKYSKAKLNDMKCDMCNELSNFLTVELQKPKAKTEIVYGMQHLICKELPKPFYNTCDTFVGGLLPKAFDIFAQSLQNGQACKNIRAC